MNKINIANPVYDAVFKYLVEDEYYSVIEKRDTEIMETKKAMEKKEKALQEKNKVIEAKDKELQEKNKELEESQSRLRAMVQSMKSAGMSTEAIAQAAGMTEEEVEKQEILDSFAPKLESGKFNHGAQQNEDADTLDLNGENG